MHSSSLSNRCDPRVWVMPALCVGSTLTLWAIGIMGVWSLRHYVSYCDRAVTWWSSLSQTQRAVYKIIAIGGSCVGAELFGEYLTRQGVTVTAIIPTLMNSVSSLNPLNQGISTTLQRTLSSSSKVKYHEYETIYRAFVHYSAASLCVEYAKKAFEYYKSEKRFDPHKEQNTIFQEMHNLCEKTSTVDLFPPLEKDIRSWTTQEEWWSLQQIQKELTKQSTTLGAYLDALDQEQSRQVATFEKTLQALSSQSGDERISAMDRAFTAALSPLFSSPISDILLDTRDFKKRADSDTPCLEEYLALDSLCRMYALFHTSLCVTPLPDSKQPKDLSRLLQSLYEHLVCIRVSYQLMTSIQSKYPEAPIDLLQPSLHRVEETTLSTLSSALTSIEKDAITPQPSGLLGRCFDELTLISTLSSPAKPSDLHYPHLKTIQKQLDSLRPTLA